MSVTTTSWIIGARPTVLQKAWRGSNHLDHGAGFVNPMGHPSKNYSNLSRLLLSQNGWEPCRRKRLEIMERSATVEKLIDLIGRGRCSIATAAGVSHSMVEDGVCHEAIQTFSSLGASGAFPGNYERDLRTWLKNLFNFSLETYSIPMRLQAHWISMSSNPFV